MKKRVFSVPVYAVGLVIGMASPLAVGGSDLAVKSDVHPAPVKSDVHPSAVKSDVHPRKTPASSNPKTQAPGYDLNPNDLSVKDERRGVVINHEEQYRAYPPR